MRNSQFNRLITDSWVFFLLPLITAVFDKFSLKNYFIHLFKFNLLINLDECLKDIKIQNSQQLLSLGVVLKFFLTEYALIMLFVFVSVVLSLILYSINIVAYFCLAYFLAANALLYELQIAFSKFYSNILLFLFIFFAVNKVYYTTKNCRNSKTLESNGMLESEGSMSQMDASTENMGFGDIEPSTNSIDIADGSQATSVHRNTSEDDHCLEEDISQKNDTPRNHISDDEMSEQFLSEINPQVCIDENDFDKNLSNSAISCDFPQTGVYNSENEGGLIKTPNQHPTFLERVYFNNPGPKLVKETGDSLFHFTFKFYIQLFVVFLLVSFKAFMIRLHNFPTSGGFNLLFSTFYVLYASYIICYISRAFITKYLSSYIYKDSPKMDWELGEFIFTSRVAALVKPFIILGDLIRKLVCKIFKGIAFEGKYPLECLEDDRCSYFYIVLKKTTFFEGFRKSRQCLWKGDIRNNVVKINIKEDLFPTILALGILLKCISSNVFSLFRPIEVAFIVIANFFVVIEIFNSYGVMKVIEYVKTNGTHSSRVTDIIDIPFGDEASSIKLRENGKQINDFFNEKFFEQNLINLGADTLEEI